MSYLKRQLKNEFDSDLEALLSVFLLTYPAQVGDFVLKMILVIVFGFG